MLSFELLQLTSRHLLHLFANLVDLTSLHVVKFAVVPDQLEISKELLDGRELPIEKIFGQSVEVHWPLHDLGVVEKSQF